LHSPIHRQAQLATNHAIPPIVWTLAFVTVGYVNHGGVLWKVIFAAAAAAAAAADAF